MKSTKLYAEEFLQTPGGVKKSYLRVFLVFFIAILGFSVLLGLSIKYGPFLRPVSDTADSSVVFSTYLFQSANLVNAVGGISIFALCLVVFPFICMFSL